MPYFNYSNREMADIHFFYGLADGSINEAQRLYQDAFPTRRIPDRRTFATAHRRLMDHGSFSQSATCVGNVGRPREIRAENAEEQILNRIENDPHVSTRQLSHELNLSHCTIWRIINRNDFYPYHLQRVQVLHPNDPQLRIDFCQWYLNQHDIIPNFGWNVLFTDESQFTRDGINNFHNQHHWALENPHEVIMGSHQVRFSLNVWAGIIGSHLIGPVFLPARLDGPIYRDFLTNTLPNLLNGLNDVDQQEMWFMHDGAPPHFALTARNVLNANYPTRCQ